ncbi:MAG: MFS transporter [Thermoleophilia bacterium]|nr:MFS transporter [Thermoleophilia bacterium]
MSNPLLATGDGRRLFAAQALSLAGHGISTVALPWLVLEQGGSEAAAGLVFTFTTLPYVLFALPAGVVGDRFPVRGVIWVAHAAQALCALAVPLWSIVSPPPTAAVLAAAFAIGAGRVFSDAAVFGAVAAVVPRSEYVRGQATLGAAWAVGLLAGPALGGALVSAIGPARSLAAEAGTLVLAALVVRATAIHLEVTVAARRARTIVRDAVRSIFGHPVLRAVTFLGVGWAFASAGSWALAVPLLREELGLSSTRAGIVLGAGALAGIAASPVVGALSRRLRGVGILLLAIPVSALATATVGLSPGFALVLVAYTTMSLADYVATAAYIGERQTRAALELQSTVGILGRTLVMLALAAGSAAASALTTAISLKALYVGMATATGIVVAVAAPFLLRAARAGHAPLASSAEA